MDSFVSRKHGRNGESLSYLADDDSTEVKLGILASLHPRCDSDVLLEVLLMSDGSVDEASKLLSAKYTGRPKKKRDMPLSPTYQSSLVQFTTLESAASLRDKVTKKGRTLHLYSPEDVATHTPCTILHNFLPPNEADALLREILSEVPAFRKDTFQLFERTVQSHHTSAFFVDDWDQVKTQKNEYFYNGSQVLDIRQSTPEMMKVSVTVRDAVNLEIAKRIQSRYPNGKKLKYQSSKTWIPNTALVNCYDGGIESVGYHSDQLTHIGPRAVIGSLSLGVSREFRVRKILPRDDIPNLMNSEIKKANEERADAEGQISIHLPHNSLLIMHAEMQEEWKHSVAPAQRIEPHPLAKNKRINITYRCYRDSFHPQYTPKCKCGVPTILRCVQKKHENRGRYMWMCHVNYAPGKEGCGFFKWAEFDDDGEPPWATKSVGI